MGLAALFFIVNGLGQSTGYPGCISIVSNWFSKANNGLVFGLWGTSLNIGDIIGQQIGRFVIDEKEWEWQIALFITAAFFVFFLLVLIIVVKISPKDLIAKKKYGDSPLAENLEVHAGYGADPSHGHSGGHGGHGQGGISFWSAWKIKNVPQFALAFFCTKGVIYGVIFWLPSYLENDVGLTGDISLLLASIEIGQILGSILLGILSDRIKSRSISICFGFFFAVIFLILTFLIKSIQVKSLYFILLFLAGVGIGGPASLIGGAVASDLGQRLAEKNAVSAISTVVGIMEGCGASGAAFTQIFVSNFTSIVFPFFSLLCLIGGALMTPIAIQDYKKRKNAGVYQQVSEEEDDE